MICELETHYFIAGNFYYLIDQVLNADWLKSSTSLLHSHAPNLRLLKVALIKKTKTASVS